MTADAAVDERPTPLPEVAKMWADQQAGLEELDLKFEALVSEIDAAKNQFGHITETLHTAVDSQRPRRVFETDRGLVLVERVRGKSKKYKVGDTPPPPTYITKATIIEVE